MPTRFIITSHLHQDLRKWELLVRVVEEQKPRFVLVAGDLLPIGGGFEGQRRFFSALADHLGAMRDSGLTTVLTFFGNDDFHRLEGMLDDLAARIASFRASGRSVEAGQRASG
jgi:Icc-related predicted phosphoesterase